MKQIKINRTGDTVTFDEVSINFTENVFFTNMDKLAEHWPTICDNKLGKYKSPNSSQCTVPSGTPPYDYQYGCKVKGHEKEKGTIHVFAQLAAGTTTLAAAKKGTAIARQQVVVGGKSKYKISGAQFQITGNSNQKGSGIGPGLSLDATTDNTGVWVSGTPTVSGTYNFTFTVDDDIGQNLQQVQYKMVVA